MEGPEGKQEKQKAGKTVRFRVASANSGRVLAEVFKDEASRCGSPSGSVDSDGASSPGAEQGSEANSHLNGLAAEAADANGCEPDDLLLYASAKRETVFSNKRVNICSKNGTIRGVRNKVSAGQELFNNLSGMYSVSMAAAPSWNTWGRLCLGHCRWALRGADGFKDVSLWRIEGLKMI
ncbi:Glutaredoxin domain-containing cysteine-rich protein 1 [Liparis tanakae]|uniref:Glutaredoxin domain-containing cysteine-rich protein 1 n=1 Tax=Liparis tanakae TaxID=230148 RepID=A0A4Z2IM80_9TELE|nr:Glutaredoxin domain-containing cysteine-rich protein 1 [Liparis tanakae]